MKLNLIGTTQLLDGNGELVQLPTKKVLLLLSILAMHAGIEHSRSSLAESIWPNAHMDAGRTSLRNALAALRKVLPPDSLKTDGDNVLLVSQTVLCDALDESMETFGEFMPSFNEDWVLDHRLQLRSLAINHRLEKARDLVASGDEASALEMAEAACKIDPLNQDAAQLKVQILERLGKTPDVAKAANSFHARVLRELGVVINIESPPLATESNPLTVTCEWLVERNPEEAASFLVGTRSSWMAMGGTVALGFHQKVLDAYVKRTPTRTLVEAQFHYLQWIVGEFDRSHSDTQLAFKSALANDEDEAATILGTALAFGFLSQGKFKESVRHCQLVREIALRSNRPIELVKADRNLAIIEQHLGRDGVWENRVRATSQIVEEHGIPDEVAQQNLIMALVLIKEGKLDKASTVLAQARRFFESSGGRRMVGYCLLTQAMIEEAIGDFLAAIETINRIRGFGSNVIGHSLAAACNDFDARLQSRIGEFDFSAESVARATLIRRQVGSTPSIYEVTQLNPTKRILKEQLTEQDLRAAYARAKLLTEPARS